MGFNCKQVISSDGLDWSETLLEGQTLELQPKPPVGWLQQQQNPPETQTDTMKCPRCYSTNTKFCYYNNYKKSQPRHFCKTCKRHWTKGGTLRNVPVGGGRKNKRLKTSKTSAKGAATAPSENGNMINRVNQQMVIEAQQQKQNLPLSLGDHQKQKGMSEIMCRALISPPSFSVVQQNFISCSSNNNHDNNNNGAFLRSNLSSLSQNKGLHFPCSTSNSSSISTSFGSTNDYNYSTATDQTMEDSIITAIMPTTNSSTMTQPWQLPNTSYWNWDDLDTFVPTDLNIPSWDIDSELSP